jgi:3-oxoacyl-[acyl-carrier-protein] synthase-3
MSYIDTINVSIKGISCCVPTNKIDNMDTTDLFKVEELKKFIKTTGIRYRRITDTETTTSDLSYEAAENLISKLSIEKSEIDGIIFVSQTPDYILPATSITLQDRLGLKKSTFAFDVNLGCTGYVYGLSIASAFLNSGDIKNVLLLCGDTISKTVSKKDKSSVLLFGDAASATLIGKGNNEFHFSLNSDGSGKDILKINSGMFRNQITNESLKQYKWKDGNLRSDNQLYMDGMEIFNFTIKEIAKDVNRLLKKYERNISDIDYVVYHQANRFINQFINKKLKLDADKTPYSLYDYGNTSSASIPLTICSTLQERTKDLQLLLSGFGVGLSWANALITLEKNTVVCNIIEV